MIRRSRAAAVTALAVAAGLAFAGCAGSPAAAPTAAETTAGPTGSITVFAAASLTAAFTEIAADFEAENPGTTVELSFAGSADLVTQIVEGAPADVFASADQKNMTKLTDADLVAGTPVDFATNVLQIAVPPGNPAGIASFADLAGDGVRLVICAPEVPCGAATAKIEESTGVTLTPVSEESSVTDVLGKVSSGEADAGLVYVTDVLAAGDAVDGVAFDESADAVNTYPIATTRDAGNAALAEAFVAFVTGDAGRAVLTAAGFGRP